MVDNTERYVQEGNFDDVFDENVSALPANMQILLLREHARFSFPFISENEHHIKKVVHYLVMEEEE